MYEREDEQQTVCYVYVNYQRLSAIRKIIIARVFIAFSKLYNNLSLGYNLEYFEILFENLVIIKLCVCGVFLT